MVEAVSPVFDQVIAEKQGHDVQLLRILDDLLPEGISVWPRRLPKIARRP